jgi:ABC-2 type transport system ATP-binding protein
VTPLVEVDHLVRYFGNRAAVDDVTFQVETGEPTRGTVRIGGLDVRRHGAALRRMVGYVPQTLSVDGSLTARENLLLVAKLLGLPRAERRQRIAELLDRLNLAAVADQLVRTFSGGMVRRLEIGQALLHRPRLLVLDEPTVGLDPTARQAIWRMIQQLRAETGMTILVTTHYMEEADAYCQRVAIMHRGRLAAVGTPAALKAQSGRSDATLEDVFTSLTGETLESGGSYHDLQQIRRRQRLG